MAEKVEGVVSETRMQPLSTICRTSGDVHVCAVERSRPPEEQRVSTNPPLAWLIPIGWSSNGELWSIRRCGLDEAETNEDNDLFAESKNQPSRLILKW